MYDRATCCGFIVLLTAAAQPVAAQSAQSAQSEPLFLPPVNRTVITEKEAFVLGDLEKVMGASVSEVYPSPEGRYVLVVQRGKVAAIVPAMATPLTLSVWDSRTRRTRPLWQFDVPTRQLLGQVQWLAGTSVALVELPLFVPAAVGAQDREKAYHLLDLARATVRRLGSDKPLSSTISPSTAFTRISLSPTQPVAAVIEMAKVESEGLSSAYSVDKLCFVGTTGELSSPLSVRAAGGLLEQPTWSPDGRSVYLKRDKAYFSVDSRRPVLQPLAEKPEVPKPADSKSASSGAVLRTSINKSSLTSGTTTRELRSLWLEGEAGGPAPRALLDADVDEGGVVKLLPCNSAVLLQKNGALYCLPLQRYGREAFLTRRRLALKELTLLRAQRIVQGLFSYSGDHDGRLPAADESLTAAFGRYGNPGILNDPDSGTMGLVFPNPALNLRKMDQPGTTLVGYVTGPEGRAQIWGDGHITWQDDPKISDK